MEEEEEEEDMTVIDATDYGPSLMDGGKRRLGERRYSVESLDTTSEDPHRLFVQIVTVFVKIVTKYT